MAYATESYIHEMDRKAFAALNHFPYFVKMMEIYQANYDEKVARINYLSSAIRLSENQMPEIYNLLPPICEKLGIDVPELYYVRSKEMNASTIGTKHPCICIHSALVRYLSIEQIASVLAHECGHIACKHSLYHSIVINVINQLNEQSPKYVRELARFITPGLVNAFLFWDRCSELSADRAAVLCDGKSETMVDTLLRIHGYNEINRDEFIKQAFELHDFVSGTKDNQFIEQMIVSNDTHPRLATRVYECCTWSKTECFRSILNGTYQQIMANRTDLSEEEIITAELELKEEGQKSSSFSKKISAEPNASHVTETQYDAALKEVNKQLERYTFQGDRKDYALAIASGVLAGFVDAIFVEELSLDCANQWGIKQVNEIVFKVAKYKGYKGKHIDLESAVRYLEKDFPIAADKMTNSFGGGLQHHLRDFSHHPSLLGLICSFMTQFTGKVYGTDVHGDFIAVKLDKNGLELVGRNFPEKVTFGIINWFFHLVSDMAGSSGTIMAGGIGTGIPGPILSFAKECSSLPLFKSRNEKGYKIVSVYISKLFNGTLLVDKDGNRIRFDLRTEMGLGVQIAKQAIPVVINECVVRAFYFIHSLMHELARRDIRDVRDLDQMNWKSLIPFHNRTIDRMLMISSMTFTIADTADAAVHAAIVCNGDFILFSKKFISRFNYLGAGRAALAIVKEVSNEKKEAQLIHEKLILTDAKTSSVIERFSAYREGLEQRLSNYLAEDIEIFFTSFKYINQGIESGDSNLVIKGNVLIQKVLGKEPQFTTQEEFDAFMDSDEVLVF